ncbi:lactonase family protein [Paenibacillus filicis]|uniref:Lactonase family protein n=1 Tax=Paenibacillus gyeongsangnamensis TaxID=3388067 RepID=A0ABT4QJ88_9BACL|nr:lactonase family protein [Paenibacillus filicis]MCZ8516930.1 lactonase family protein [Paenibacillus filicis]
MVKDPNGTKLEFVYGKDLRDLSGKAASNLVNWSYAACKDFLGKEDDNTMNVFIGCVASEGAPSIYVSRFDEDLGKLSVMQSYSELSKSAYVTMDSKHNLIYVVGMEGAGTGFAVSYAYDPGTASLRLISKQATLGANPNYVSADPSFTMLFAANYGGETISVLPLKPGGSIDSVSRCIFHEGSSIVIGPQNTSHPHCILPDPSNRFAIVADLGTDLIYFYRIDHVNHDLALERTQPIAPGSGPRHLIFHHAMSFAYMINELSSTIIVYKYDASVCALKDLQTISTLPEGFNGVSKCADIQLSQCGNFVYGTNRGHDSIVVYKVNGDGTLVYLEHVSSGGEKPRSIAVSPDGRFLLATNEGSNQVVTFAIHPSGKLELAERLDLQSAPICIKFIP